MTQKKKAELQRKLSIAPIPRPPDDLLARIKADIPELERTQRERDRFSRSAAFNLRVAASILLVITSAFLGIRLLSPGNQRDVAPMMAPATSAAFEAKQEQAAEVTVLIDESVALKKEADTASVRPAEATRNAYRAVPRSRDEAESNVVVEGPPPAAAPPAARMAAPMAAAPPPPPAPAPVVETGRVAEGRRDNIAAQRIAATSKSAGLVGSVQAADLAYQTGPELFGVAVDGKEFDRLKSMVEANTRPEPESVNVEALVNHFAGSPATTRQDVSLQVEGSQAPLPDTPAMLRVTVDTAALGQGAAGTRPPVGTDATLEIRMNDAAVASYHVVGSGELVTTERVLLKGSSATRLIELTLKPGLRRSQEVARVTLRYRSVGTGREVVLKPRSLPAGEFVRPWTSASRRHRLATLGALWGESLRAAEPSGEEVARKAESLSSEEPNDARARELAAAARTSSSKGSGR